MNENKKLPLPDEVLFVINRLEKNGFRAYAVGGCVRDFIMGRIPGDYDVTTSAKPDEMLAVFSDCRVVETGLKHGTLTVVKNGMNIETTTYRIDGSYTDGRHPDSVHFTDRLSDDLVRRDFTVNAMAYSPESGTVDLYGGISDIEKKIIRCVGSAEERFNEDGLRILRALRFSSTLGFTLDGECSSAARRLAPLLDKISRERVHVELTKLIFGDGAERILHDYADIVSRTLPPLTEDGVKLSSHSIGRMKASTLGISPSYAALFACLFDTLTYDGAKKAIISLKPSRDEEKSTLALLSSRKILGGVNTNELEYTVLGLMCRYGDSFPKELALFEESCLRLDSKKAAEAAEIAENAVRSGKCRNLSMLSVSGSDLVSRGMRGESIGLTLQKMLESVMRGESNNEKEELIKKFLPLQA